MAEGENCCDIVDSWEDIDETQIASQSLILMKPPLLPQGSILVKEDDARSQYMPPEPSVKILKRPSREDRLNSAANDTLLNGAGKPIKSLQQREAEYAEARLRIMGSSGNYDCDFYDRVERLNGESATPSAVYMLLRPQTDSSQCPPGVLRNPRGPDDTNGFTLRR